MKYIVTIEKVQSRPLIDIILVRTALVVSIVVLILGLIIESG